MSSTDQRSSLSRSTVAILGDSPVICRAIAHLFERGGYKSLIVDTMCEEPELADVDVVLLSSGLGKRCRGESNRTVPVLRLVDTPEEKESLKEESILWPCTTRELHSALGRAAATHGD